MEPPFGIYGEYHCIKITLILVSCVGAWIQEQMNIDVRYLCCSGQPLVHEAVWVLSFISFYFLYPSTFNILEVRTVCELIIV